MNYHSISKPVQLMLTAINNAVKREKPFAYNDNIYANNPVFCELMFSALVEIVDNKIYPINK